MANNITVGILRALLTLDTAQFESGIRQAGTQSRKFEGELRRIGGNMTTLGSQMTAAVTLPIVAAFGGATKAAIDFESSFAGVRKTVDASESEFKAISDQFRGLSKEIPVSVHELNRLGESAGALGIPKEEIVGFSKVMAQLGVTTNVTSDQAAESIAKIQNIFGASGKFTEQFASTLVDLGNKGASTEQEILSLATRIASAGNTLGMSQAQVLAFSSAIANVGMEAEAGGSAFSRVAIEMSKAVSAGGAELQAFAQVAGMSTTQFATLFKTNAAGAIQSFIEGLGRIKQSGGDLNATLGALGFTEIRQSDLLRRLAGAADMVGFSLTTANSAWTQNTALQDEAAKRFATVQSQLTLLWNKLTDVGVTLGTALLPVITMFVGWLDKLIPIIETLVGWFTQLPVPLQAAVIGFAAFVAALGPILLIAGQVAMGIAALSGLGGFAGLAAAIGPVVAFFTTALPAAFAAVMPFLGPIGLIAAGVGAVLLAWKYWDQIVVFFQTGWQLVVESLKYVPTLLLPLLGPIGLVLATFKHWDQIGAITQAVYTAIKTWLVDKFAAVVKFIGEKVGQVTGFFKNMYTAVVGQSYVPDMVTGIGYEFGRLDGLMVGPAERSTSLVQSTFQSMSNAVNDTVSDMLRKVSSMLTGWLDSFMPSWAAKLLGGVAESVIGNITSKLTGGGLGGLGGGGFGGMGGGGGILGKIPGLGGLFGGGGGSSMLGSGAAINAQTAALGGAGGGGMGALGAFFTNPFTLAGAAGVALGLAIWKKGLFRGGEEAMHVNPRRDSFLSQFGDPANKDVGGGGWNLANALVRAGAGDGGGELFRAFQRADTVKAWESAQANVVALLQRTGMQVQSFAQGGFVPPGMVTPAILHGGSKGEIIAPVEKMGMSITFAPTIVAWDGADVKRAMPALIREFKTAMLLNQDGIVTAQRRALEA